jgi:hypothetical protein
MTTIPDSAVEAALAAYRREAADYTATQAMRAALTAAAPHLAGGGVEDARDAERYRWWREHADWIAEDGDGLAGCAFSCQIHPDVIEQKSSTELMDMIADLHTSEAMLRAARGEA